MALVLALTTTTMCAVVLDLPNFSAMELVSSTNFTKIQYRTLEVPAFSIVVLASQKHNQISNAANFLPLSVVALVTPTHTNKTQMPQFWSSWLLAPWHWCRPSQTLICSTTPSICVAAVLLQLMKF